jgi:hypothetical protein
MIQGIYTLQVDLTAGDQRHDQVQAANAKAIYATEGVSGVQLYQMHWDQMEQSPGVFDFSVFDQTVALLPSGFGLMLSIHGGLHAPSWLWQQQGCPTVAISFPHQVGGKPEPTTLPLYWVDQYLQAYIGAWKAFAGHINDLVAAGTLTADQVQGMILSIYHGLDSEMTIPWKVKGDDATSASNLEAYATAGYTPTAALAGWSWAVDELAELYPSATLSFAPMTPSTSLPWIDDDGNVIAKGDSTTDMLAYFEHAGETYGLRAMVVDTALATQARPPFYDGTCDAGCRMGCQTNAWGDGGTTESGSHKDQGSNDAAAFTSVLENGETWCAPNPVYIEVHPGDCSANAAAIGAFAARINV